MRKIPFVFYRLCYAELLEDSAEHSEGERLQVQQLISSKGDRGPAALDRRERSAEVEEKKLQSLSMSLSNNTTFFVRVHQSFSSVYSTCLSSAWYWVTSRQGAKQKR